MESPVCVVVGAGEGLGGSIADRFYQAGYSVACCVRSKDKAESVVTRIRNNGANSSKSNSLSNAINHRIEAFSLDSTDEAQVKQVFNEIRAKLGPVRVLVYNAAQRKFREENVMQVSIDTVEAFWRVNCLGALLCARQVIPDMLESTSAFPSSTPSPLHKGTILLTGATASLRALSGLSSMAIGKFGLRALGQSMAREFSPQGIHVCHVIVDGAIDSPLLRSYVDRKIKKVAATDDNRSSDDSPTGSSSVSSSSKSSSSSSSSSQFRVSGEVAFLDRFLHPTAIAEQYFQIHSQHQSCWTQELDVRPFAEPIYARM